MNKINVIVNFEKVDEYTTNKYMAFFTGATMMVDGKVMRINENTILFTLKENFISFSFCYRFTNSTLNP